jgi:hypothetical protein
LILNSLLALAWVWAVTDSKGLLGFGTVRHFRNCMNHNDLLRYVGLGYENSLFDFLALSSSDLG